MSSFGPTAARLNLRTLHLESCWEIGNQGILSIAHGLPNLTVLSLSGCSKVTDDAIEVIAEQLRHLTSLNLSWCARITDASLEYIACDLADSLKELILDRCVHVTDIGLGYAATMGKLTTLSLRWCPQIRDFGVQTLCSMKYLKSLSLAGKAFDPPSHPDTSHPLRHCVLPMTDFYFYLLLCHVNSHTQDALN
jgi:F-box/leucine-rich repeat protein 16